MHILSRWNGPTKTSTNSSKKVLLEKGSEAKSITEPAFFLSTHLVPNLSFKQVDRTLTNLDNVIFPPKSNYTLFHNGAECVPLKEINRFIT